MSQIKAGDLVMVVRNSPCGCASRCLGLPYTVTAVMESHSFCSYCNRLFDISSLARIGANDVVALWRLIKIDPPALPETIKHDEEITA